MTFLEALIFSGATLVAAAIMAWRVLRPFEHHRRELHEARKRPAE